MVFIFVLFVSNFLLFIYLFIYWGLVYLTQIISVILIHTVGWLLASTSRVNNRGLVVGWVNYFNKGIGISINWKCGKIR